MKNNFCDSNYEIIFINDGSTDNSWNEICDVKKHNTNIIAINLQRNYGQATALQVWFENSSWDLIITLDWDGQNNPKDIKRLYDKMINENLDVVAWWRKDRKDKIEDRKSVV